MLKMTHGEHVRVYLAVGARLYRATLGATPMTDRPNHAAALAHALTLPDPARRVAGWILKSMTETFLLDAFARACDECPGHPYAPGPGGDYADHMPEPSADQRAEAEDKAGALYLAILAAPGGYDPAPALVRWCDPYQQDHWVSGHWLRRFSTGREAAARCWGHYAVMEALGHGVAWSDDNEPLTGPPRHRNMPEGETCPTCDHVIRHADGCPETGPDLGGECDGDELPAVGDLDGVSADSMEWEDDYTRAAFNARIEAERAAAEREDARREAYEERRRND